MKRVAFVVFVLAAMFCFSSLSLAGGWEKVRVTEYIQKTQHFPASIEAADYSFHDGDGVCFFVWVPIPGLSKISAPTLSLLKGSWVDDPGLGSVFSVNPDELLIDFAGGGVWLEFAYQEDGQPVYFETGWYTIQIGRVRPLDSIAAGNTTAVVEGDLAAPSSLSMLKNYKSKLRERSRAARQ